MEFKWNNWIQVEYMAQDDEYYTVSEWTKAFVHNGLVPEMKKCGYVFPTNEHGIINSFLNFLFHFEQSYYNMSQCKYIGKHGRKMNWSNEDYCYFLDFKCSSSIWEKLRTGFPIEHFSDDSDFSQRLWEQIPSTVFFMIDIKNSPSTDELAERLAWLESDDEEDNIQQKKKTTVDPYLLDYGKDRYKYAESETRI